MGTGSRLLREQVWVEVDVRCQPFGQTLSVAPQVLYWDSLFGQTTGRNRHAEGAGLAKIKRLLAEAAGEVHDSDSVPPTRRTGTVRAPRLEASGWTNETPDGPCLVLRMRWHDESRSALEPDTKVTLSGHKKVAGGVGIEGSEGSKSGPITGIELIGPFLGGQLKGRLDNQFSVSELDSRLVVDSEPRDSWVR